MNKSGYMTNDMWVEVVKRPCKGLRALPVVSDHPKWWILVSLDGFASHVNRKEANEIFTSYKVMVLKEEANTVKKLAKL